MLASLEGTRFCLVYMEVLDAATQKLKLTPVHGVARVLPDRLVVEESSGVQTAVPDSALSAILPSDGNALLKDAAHYVIVKMAASA
mgnify:CR=1 FL=1|jgi:hypothetical protein